ncbi:response regulator [Aquincola sp. MAHUQ-54]|uniref:histidine kinase n=1 Tax=Aquincola agrisoli TaxID=3119538 RepID=A0AAW9Q513_9BURK
MAVETTSLQAQRPYGATREPPAPGADAPGPAPGRADTPLVRWLRTVLLAAVIVPGAAFVGMAGWALERARTDAEDTTARASQMALSHVQRTFAVAEEIGRRAAAATAGDDDEVRADEAALHQRLNDIVAGVPALVNLNVWDAAGRAVARSDQRIDPGASAGDRTYFTEMQDRSIDVGISEVIVGRQTGRELFNVTLRRPSPDGSFRGVVAVSLAPSYFRSYYESIAADDPRLASFALIKTDGSILARWPPAEAGRQRVAPGAQTLARIQAGEDAGVLVTRVGTGREARLLSFRRVPGYPVYVVAGFSRDAMFADWLRLLWLLAAVLLPVSAGLAGVAWVAIRKTRLEHEASAALREESRRRFQAEQAVMEAQKLETLAVLTGGVAHDFNNLLAIVQTNLHVHRRKHPALAEAPQLQAMARAIRAGVRLTRQLLSFSRKQALKPETIRLQAWLPHAAELLQSTLGRAVQAEFKVDADTASIHVDAGELELALINLALNARHAMPKGGTFRVSAFNDEAHPIAGRPAVNLCVQDDGAGIPADILPRVVEPFFTTRERGAGSGLGLSQVHGFCVQAGGRLDIDSTVGAGTRVCMRLPAVPPADAAPHVEELQAPVAQALRGSVLLVEDNEDVASSTQAMLTDAGLSVARARSAQAALDYLAQAPAPPDLVLSDIAMPGALNGIGLAFRLREERPDLPVLLTTGYAEQLSLAVSGGFEVLPKPTAPEDLLRRIQRILQP